MRFTIFSILFLACSTLQAAVRQEMNGKWEFIKSDMGSIWEVFRPAKKNKPECYPLWQTVTLPHCFNATDAVNPYVNYYQGPGWYRTFVNISNPYPGGRTIIEFDGAGQKTDVYVHTVKVGKHVGGYDKWCVDITDAVAAFRQKEAYRQQFKCLIPIAIRCDNSRNTEIIPSDMSDFNLYGGLYRPLRITYVPQTHLTEVHVRPQIATAKATDASVTVSAKVNGKPSNRMLEAVIRDPKGNIVARAKQPLDGKNTCEIKDISIKKPVKWDVDSPRLYTCEVTISKEAGAGNNGNKAKSNGNEAPSNGNGSKNGNVTEADSKLVRFGFRSFEFKEHGPFMLNGRRLLLQGTHTHEDFAGMGAAQTDEVILKEMLQMKEMGVNFIRLGHYQQHDRVLELCDSLGILVWEEIPWCRGGLGGTQYKEQARRMLNNMISQHYNHPSVIVWGLGNENDWPGDFEKYDKDSIHSFMAELNGIAHRLDNSRNTVIRRCDFCSDVVDVYAPTIWPGWYKGAFTEYRKFVGDAINKYPRFLHTEWGGDSHARRHSESDFKGVSNGDKNSDWSETYIVKLFDWSLKEQLQMPQLTGAAFWTFRDFSTPLRPDNPVPYVNQKGVVERDGTLKESYYVFQSYWTKKPMVHIYGHTWPVRWGAKDEEKEILVYSNCSEVELFVNGKSAGKRKRDIKSYPACGLNWKVKLQEGSNTIRAVAREKGQTLSDEITQEYQTERWGEPALLSVSRKHTADDTVEIEAWLTDKNGVRCLDAANWIAFDLTGDGRLLADLGTSTGSRRVQAYNGRALIRAKLNGKACISVKSPGLETVLTVINKK